ncbi:coil containing protein [Vibrio phage 1.106.O._10N.286.51.F7]|nr:coil containing protein [Vibrio phage 1.106.O._10N.286.51.F7]
MTTYNTYQEAKIANPESVIYEFEGYFSLFKDIGSKECNPADHCMTVEKFLVDGYKTVNGDWIIDYFGNVWMNMTGSGAHNVNNFTGNKARESFILRAAALEKIPTETPEEKEVLDSIEIAGEVEWKNGDVGEVNGEKLLVISYHPLHPSIVIVETNDNEYLSVGVDMLKKPETQKQREDRERLEAAYDLYEEAQHAIGCIGYDDFDFFKKSDIQVKFWLAIVDKTNYRKEKTHGTN